VVDDDDDDGDKRFELITKTMCRIFFLFFSQLGSGLLYGYLHVFFSLFTLDFFFLSFSSDFDR